MVHDQPEVPVAGEITTPHVEATAPADEQAPTEPASPPPPSTAVAIESLLDFYAQLSASVSAGDGAFALDRLDPRVFEIYPDSCPEALASFADPDLVIEFLERGATETWTFEAEGQAIEIPDAIAVTIRLTGRGQAGEPSEAHVSIIDGEYHWFTFC